MMMKVIITDIKDRDLLAQTMESLWDLEESFRHRIRIVFVWEKDGMPEAFGEEVKRLRASWGEQLTQVNCGENSVWKICEEEFSQGKEAYVTKISAGDVWQGDSLEKGCEYLEAHKEETDVLFFTQVFQSNKKKTAGGNTDQAAILCRLDLEEDCLKCPATYEGAVFRREGLKGITFYETHGYDIWDDFVLQVLARKRTCVFLKQGYFVTVQPQIEKLEENPEMRNRAWYLDSLEKHCIPELESFEEKEGKVPYFVQTHVLFQLLIRFKCNQNQTNLRVFEGKGLEDYLFRCRNVLRRIDDVFLVKRTGIAARRVLTEAMSWYFLNLKYEGDPKRKYRLEEFPSQDGKSRETALAMQVGEAGPYMRLYPKLRLEILEAENGVLRLDVAVPGYIGEDGYPLTVLLNGKEIRAERISYYLEQKFFGRTVYEEHGWKIRIPIQDLKEKNRLQAVLMQGKKRMALPVTTMRYPSRLTGKRPHSYWTFDQYLIRLKKGAEEPGFYIIRAGLKEKMIQELKFQYRLWRGKDQNREMARVRGLYWLTRPWYRKKNIWITFDKLYKGGDCGEYFYKYMCSRKDTDVVPGYVINGDSPDRKRLEREGYRPLVRGSLRQRLMFLNAKIVFGTHVNISSFNSFRAEEIVCVQDRLEFVNMCIQHGLTVQDLAYDANRVYNNNKRYYCASKYEVQNLSQPQYGYEDPKALALTGIPRYDGLVNCDKRQILITPTWRNYIVMPPVMGSTRPYNPEFRNTDYFQIYHALITDPRLVETARRTGYRLIYLLHPVMSSQIDDFEKVEGVDLIQATTVNYEEILTESSLMVTDYSGVQFDFAYMRKPVVYYHPPKLPPHYEEGGFFYDTQGFGEICREHEELVDTLCGYMETECRLKPFYRSRQDDFFAFDDRESCRRIFEDAQAYQKMHR